MDQSEHPSALGGLLHVLRQQAGLSLYELERRSGVDRGKLLRIERGQTRQPALTTLDKLAEALRVPPERLHAAVWKDNKDSLPSPRLYFRCKLGLADPEIAELEAVLERLAEGRHAA